MITSKIKIIAPGNLLDAETARNIQKIWIIEDSHIGRLNKKHFHEKINGKMYSNVFRGANNKRCITSSKLLFIRTCQIRCWYVLWVMISSLSRDVVQRLMEIGLYCRECGVKDVVISSILVERNFQLATIIWQINDLLSEYCVSSNFHYLTNDNITRQDLWNYGFAWIM